MARGTRAAVAVGVAAVCGWVVGCSRYVPPGRGAELTPAALQELRVKQGDATIEKLMQLKPLAKFPAAVAVVRVQASGYRSYTAQGYGRGAYSVVTQRDVEKEADFERLTKLPMVAGVAPVGRLLLSPEMSSDAQLREAAARLGADVLVIYTLDTTFTTEDNAAPLTVISLGLSPNRVVRVGTTASAVILDTRNGYVYGTAEATETGKQLTNAWQDETAADQARRRTESAAFGRLVTELEKTWGMVVARQGK